MVFSKKSIVALTTAALVSSYENYADAFSPLAPRNSVDVRSIPRVPVAMMNAIGTLSENCGCQETIFSGKPSNKARAINPREEIRQKTLFSVNGEQVTMDELIGGPSEEQEVSIVVFLRSLG